MTLPNTPHNNHVINRQPDGTHKCVACPFVGNDAEANRHMVRNQFIAPPPR